MGFLLGLSACGGGQDEELQLLTERIRGLERETRSLGRKLDESEKALARAEKRAQQAVQEADSAASDSIVYEETCGILPGDGYYSYVKVKGVDCESAEAIAQGAREAYCATQDRCLSSDPEGPDFSGGVDYEGWSCQVEVKWEQSEVSCRSGSSAILKASGA